MPIALSSLYVRTNVDDNFMRKGIEMVERVRKEMLVTIEEATWMDSETKRNAKKKAADMIKHIGYPKELLNVTKLTSHYSNLKMNSNSFLEAIIDINKFNGEYQWHRLTEHVDPADWRDHSHVVEVNAYYIPISNSIQLPLAIMQPPFFHDELPWYVNYGAIGTVIGHEITHGFDNEGRLLNSKGEVEQWWDEESEENFIQKTNCIIEQYENFNDTKNTMLRVNGVHTQGENIADNGGLKLAFRAYLKLYDEMELPDPALPGLQRYSPAQLFLLSQSVISCSKKDLDSLRVQINTGVHAPDEFRINGVVMNFVEFGKIFHCKVGEPMNPEKKCHVW